MNWRKAKNIILIMLVLLNIFLFINVMSVKDTFKATGRYQKDAKQALENAGVMINTNIPSFNHPVGRISYMESDGEPYGTIVKNLTGKIMDSDIDANNGEWQNNGKKLVFNRDDFIYTDNTGSLELPVENEKQLYKKLSAWIKSNGISKDSFFSDRRFHEGDTTIVEFVRKYKSLPIFDNLIRFYIRDGKLVKAEGSRKVFDNVKASKADEIVPANIVLLTGKEKLQGPVQAIDLGYMRLEGEDLYDMPVWRVSLKSGERVYYNAYTGEWFPQRYSSCR